MNNRGTTSAIDWEDLNEELKKYEKARDTCPHCDICPTCGRLLWPTPHGWDSCHPRVKYI